MLINVRMPTIVVLLTFMSTAELNMKKSFITLGLDTDLHPCNESILKIKLHFTEMIGNKKSSHSETNQ